MSVEARILDSLRPIFPQLNDHVLSKCIRDVQETVGSDLDTITRECVDLLLSEKYIKLNEIEVKDKFVTSKTHVREHLNVVNFPFVNDDDVVSTYRTPKVTGNRKINDTPSILNTATPSPRSQNTGKTDIVPRRNLPFEKTTSPAVARSPTSTYPPQKVPGVEVQQQEAQINFRAFFPDVEDSYLQSLLDKWFYMPLIEAINTISNELLDKRNYPRKSSTSTTTSATGLTNVPASELQCELLEKKDKLDTRKSSSSTTTKSSGEAQNEKDYMKDFSCVVSGKYSEQCYRSLQNEFRNIPVKYIKIAFSKFKGHYASTRSYLQEQFSISKVSDATATSTTTSASQNVTSAEVTNSSNDGLGFSKPPKIPLLKRRRALAQERNKRFANPAEKDTPCHKQPPAGSKRQVPNQDMQSVITPKKMAPPESSKKGQISNTVENKKKRGLPKGSTQSTAPVKVARTGRVKEGIPCDDELEELSTRIADDWMQLGRRLLISSGCQAKLDQIDLRMLKLNEKAYRMLLCWKQENSSNATYSILSDALCHKFVNRRDLAENICFHKESRA